MVREREREMNGCYLYVVCPVGLSSPEEYLIEDLIAVITYGT
jgi:hypothetical protein